MFIFSPTLRVMFKYWNHCVSPRYLLIYQCEISFNLLITWILKDIRRYFRNPALCFMNEWISVTVWAFTSALLHRFICSQLHFKDCMWKQGADCCKFRFCFNAWGVDFYKTTVWEQRLWFWEIPAVLLSFVQLWLWKSLSFEDTSNLIFNFLQF